MRAIAGTIVSSGAAVVYTIVGIIFISLDPFVLMQAATNLIGVLVTFLLSIMLLPFIMFLKVLSIAVIGLVISGAILIGVGKTKPGGIIMIVGSAVGGLICWIWYFVPVAVGVTGGILGFKEK